ncbi:MAG: glycosyltransferase [Phycisphaera sp.]|nr:glycosyltransferase [Phycisphaera sp.]
MSADTKQPRKVAIFTEYLDPRARGSNRHVYEVAKGLAQRGHHVTVLAGYVPAAIKDQPFEIVRRSKRKHFGLASAYLHARWAKDQVNSNTFDAVLSMTPNAPGHVVQVLGGAYTHHLQRMRQSRRGLAGLLRNAVQWCSLKHRVYRSMERSALRSPLVRKIVVHGRYDEAGFKNDTRLTVLTMGIAQERPPAPQRIELRRVIRAALNIPQEATVFLYAGITPTRHALATLLNAVQRIAVNARPIHVILAGCVKYPQQRMAADLGVRGCVTFVGFTRGIDELFCASDVALLPTYHDPVGRFGFEAMAFGLPLIVSRHTGVAETVEREEAGIVIHNPDDVEELVKAMSAMCDVDQRAHYAASAQLVRSSLSMDRHIEDLEKLLFPDP